MGRMLSEKQQASAAMQRALISLGQVIFVAIDDWDGKEPLGPHLRVFLVNNRKRVTLAVASAGGVAGSLGAVAAWQASLGAIGSIGAWLGLVSMPMWAPAAGLLVGVGATAALAVGVTKKVGQASANHAAALRAPVTSVIIQACLKGKKAETGMALLRDALLGSGASEEKVRELLDDSPARTPRDVTLDADAYTQAERRQVLKQAWSMVRLLGRPTRAATAMHDRLCARLGVEDAGEALRGQPLNLDAVVTASAALVEAPRAQSLAEFLGPLLEMDPSEKARARRLRAARVGLAIGTAASSIAALNLGHPGLVSVIAQAYGTTRSMLEIDGPASTEKVKELLANTTRLAEGLGISAAEVKKIAKPINSVVGNTAADARNRKRRPARGPKKSVA